MKIDANEYKFPPGGGDGCVGWNYNFVSKREGGYFQEFYQVNSINLKFPGEVQTSPPSPLA